MSVFLSLVAAQFLQAWTLLPKMRRPVPPAPEAGLRVAMVTTYVPHAEPIGMLEETLRAMKAVRYPHDCWVCDEGDDPQVKALCERIGVNHFTRNGRPEFNTASGPLKGRTKYGNINAWLHEIGFARYDVVSMFDTDHAPAPHFLERSLGYLRDAGVGFVQAAQVYYNGAANLIAKGAAEETYSYYSSTLMSGFGVGYVVVVGCHCTHRSSALREIGGLPAHDADDLLAGLEYLAAGWRGVYVPETLAIGVTPVDWASYLTQQQRWARSVFDIKLHVLPKLWGRLSPPARMLALGQGLSYFLEILLPVLGVLLLCSILITGQSSILSRLFGAEFLLFLLALAAIDVFRQRFYLNPAIERGFHWRAAVLRSVKWFAVAAGVAQAALGRAPQYEITPKAVASGAGGWVLLSQLVLGSSLAIAYGYALWSGTIGHWSLHFWSILIVTSSVALFLLAFRRPPSGFDRRLFLREWARYFGTSQRALP